MNQLFPLFEDWKFHYGNPVPPAPRGHRQTYLSTKAGEARGAARPFYPDHAWERVSVPHDWAVSLPFSKEANMSGGYKPRGEGWYRRTFTLPEEARGSHVELIFQGISGESTIYLNGYRLHHQTSSYNTAVVDISDVALFGRGTNLLAVYVDARNPDGWWYEGAGIYRPVELRITPAQFWEYRTLWASPRPEGSNWTATAQALLVNRADEALQGTVRFTLTDPEGELIAQQEQALQAEPHTRNWINQELVCPSPRLWSPENPALYSLESVLLDSRGTEIDRQKAPVGFRTLEFCAERGFLLNGEPYKLKGTCNHQDHAGVGAAVNREIIRWRIQRLKELGSNAYRSAHNPASFAVLEECDRQGLLVIDEARHFGSDPESMAQLEEMIIRHRRHPSVFLWSLFNEEPIQGKAVAARFVKAMKARARQLDPSRPVNAGMNGGFMDPPGAAPSLDVAGINYHIGFYDAFRERFPDQPVIASETASTLSTRGVFSVEETTEPESCHLTDLDNNKPFWGATAEEAWLAVATREFMGGTFVWTGFDYRGEPTPFEWPAISSQFGIYDTCGFDKANAFLYRAYWLNQPVCHILPWEETADYEEFPLRIYTNADTLTILLDDEKPTNPPTKIAVPPSRKILIPRRPRKKVTVTAFFPDVEEPQVITRQQPDAPVALELIPHKPSLTQRPENFPDEAWLVTCRAVDDQGRFCPGASGTVNFTLAPGTRLLGVGNGDPRCHEADHRPRRSLFKGLCQILVQPELTPDSQTENRPPLEIGASMPRVKGAYLQEISGSVPGVKPTDAPPKELLPAPPLRLPLEEWWQSPPFTEQPDPALEVSDQDMNSWYPRILGPGTPPEGPPQWRLYRTQLDLPQKTEPFTICLRWEQKKTLPEIFIQGRPYDWSEENNNFSFISLTAPTEELLEITLRHREVRESMLEGPLYLELP